MQTPDRNIDDCTRRNNKITTRKTEKCIDAINQF